MSDIQIMKKGEAISIATKEGKKISNLLIEMGWKTKAKANATDPDFDLDLTIPLLDKDGKVKNHDYVVDYEPDHLQFKVGSEVVVQHSADDLKGSTGADVNEWATIKLDKLPAEVSSLEPFINMYEAKDRKQHFGDVESAFVRLINMDTNEVFAKYELEKEFSGHSGVVLLKIYRVGSLWEVKVLAKPVDGEILEILKSEGMVS